MSSVLRVRLKVTAAVLDCLISHVISIKHVNTHSCTDDADAPLVGYSDQQIQKLGCWQNETFNKCVWDSC